MSAVTKTPYILLIIIIYILKSLDIRRLYYYRGASSNRDTLYFTNYLYLKKFPQAKYNAYLPTSSSPYIAALQRLI